jgi:hypothetical protein
VPCCANPTARKGVCLQPVKNLVPLRTGAGLTFIKSLTRERAFARLAQMEVAMRSHITMDADDTLLPTAKVRSRYGGVSAMWVERRLADDPNFPKPIYIAKRRFWRLGDLVAWERVKAAVA